MVYYWKSASSSEVHGYIDTYYAIGAALPLSLANYIPTGWIADELDHSYLPS